MNSIEIKSESGATFQGYFASPAGSAKGLVVVVQEIYGVNREVRRVTDEFARNGFAAVAPDLLWRVKPWLDFDYADRDNARKAIMSLKDDEIVSDIVAAMGALKKATRDSDQLKVGILALGWGGKPAYAAAARQPVAAIGSYYPGTLEGSEDLVRSVSAAQIFHFAAKDPRTKPEFRNALSTKLAGRADVEVHVYEEPDHGFANRDRPEFHQASAELADRRTLEFFQRHLAG